MLCQLVFDYQHTSHLTLHTINLTHSQTKEKKVIQIYVSVSTIIANNRIG